RAAVLASSVSPSGNGIDGLGAVSRDSGQSRFPAPRDRITGTIRGFLSFDGIGAQRRNVLNSGESIPHSRDRARGKTDAGTGVPFHILEKRNRQWRPRSDDSGGELVSTGIAKQLGACRGADPRKSTAI